MEFSGEIFTLKCAGILPHLPFFNYVKLGFLHALFCWSQKLANPFHHQEGTRLGI